MWQPGLSLGARFQGPALRWPAGIDRDAVSLGADAGERGSIVSSKLRLEIDAGHQRAFPRRCSRQTRIERCPVYGFQVAACGQEAAFAVIKQNSNRHCRRAREMANQCLNAAQLADQPMPHRIIADVADQAARRANVPRCQRRIRRTKAGPHLAALDDHLGPTRRIVGEWPEHEINADVANDCERCHARRFVPMGAQVNLTLRNVHAPVA